MAEALDPPAFWRWDKLWTKTQNIHMPVEKKVIPLYIRDVRAGFLPFRDAYDAYFFAKTADLGGRRQFVSAGHFGSSTNPQPVDNFRCGRAKPAIFREFPKSPKCYAPVFHMILGFSSPKGVDE